jgi:HopA1 effector protein family
LKEVLESLPTSMQSALQDIVRNVQIDDRGCINHPSYRPMELQPDVAQRLQHLPAELRTRYITLQLQSFLYQVYFNGSWDVRPKLKTDISDSPIENNTVRGLNIEFYDQLHTSNCGEGYFDPGWLILKQEEDGSLAVQKQDLTLHIQRDRHLHLMEQSVDVGTIATIRLPRNLIIEDFYVAVGNAGPPPIGEQEVVNLYFNLTPEGSIAVMESLTRQLNAISLPFAFKVLFNPSDYNRHYTGILNINKNTFETLKLILQNIYVRHQGQFRTQVPLFTKTLSPGLALAEEPSYSPTSPETFGINRCQIIAASLLEAQQRGDRLPDKRMSCILEHFHSLQLVAQSPYLNVGSQDCYVWN